jgi:hypothetical protein
MKNFPSKEPNVKASKKFSVTARMRLCVGGMGGYEGKEDRVLSYCLGSNSESYSFSSQVAEITSMCHYLALVMYF